MEAMDSLALFAVTGADLFECAQIVGTALGLELHEFREHPFLLLASGNELSSIHRALAEGSSGRVAFLKRFALEQPN